MIYNFLDLDVHPQRVNWATLVPTTRMGNVTTSLTTVQTSIPCKVAEAPAQVVAEYHSRGITSIVRLYFRTVVAVKPGDLLVGQGGDAGRIYVVHLARHAKAMQVERTVADCEERAG